MENATQKAKQEFIWKNFMILLLWESIQNLPLAIAIILGFNYWNRNPIGIIIILFGCLFASILIRYTEKYMEPQSTESIQVTLSNFVLFSVFIILLVIYFVNLPMIHYLDIIIGAFFGGMLSFSQSHFLGTSIDFKHTFAFLIATPLALILIKSLVLSNILQIWWSIILINLLISIIITKIDYF